MTQISINQSDHYQNLTKVFDGILQKIRDSLGKNRITTSIESEIDSIIAQYPEAASIKKLILSNRFIEAFEKKDNQGLRELLEEVYELPNEYGPQGLVIRDAFVAVDSELVVNVVVVANENVAIANDVVAVAVAVAKGSISG